MGSLIAPVLFKKMFNSSAIRTYDACAFNIFCWLFGCYLSPKCCEMRSICMSHHALIMSFWPNTKQTTFSQTFFSMCVTSKACQIYKFYNVHHKPFHISPTLTSNLFVFKNQPREVTTPPEHIFCVCLLWLEKSASNLHDHENKEGGIRATN